MRAIENGHLRSIGHGAVTQEQFMPTGNRSPRVTFNDPLRLLRRVLTKLFTIWVKLAYPFDSFGRGVSIHPTCDLQNTGLIRIGNFVSLHKDVWLHAQLSSANHAEPALIVDDYCYIGRRSHVSARNSVHLERSVMLGASVLIEDNGHSFSDISVPIRDQGMTEGGTIRIGQGCWIGQGAAIICQKGELTLGRNSVVAANAVVTRSAPPYSVLSGNPARIVKQYDPAKGVWVLGSGVAAEVRS